MMRRLGLPALAAGMLLLGLVDLASADTVHRKDGRRVDGEIIKETDDEVIVQTKFGPVTIPRSDVLRISKGATPVEQFRERWDEVDRGDALALLDLADWCKENRLSREARKVLREVIKVEPDNELARRGLGYQLVDGEWMTRREIAAAERKAEAERRRSSGKGSSSSEGPSRRPSSGSRTAADNIGDVSSIVEELLAPISSNESEDLETKQVLEDFFGQDFNVASSTHFSLRCQLPMPDIHQHLATAERLFVSCNRLFGRQPAQALWNQPFMMFHVKQEGTFIDLIDWVDKNIQGLDAETKKFFKDSPGGMKVSQVPLGALKESELPFERGMAHWIGDTYMQYSAGNCPPWLREGFGAYVAIMEFGANELTCSTNTKYANRVEVADKNSDGAYKLICYDIIDGALEEPHPFLDMTQKSLNQLDYADLAKAWSVIDFLMAEHAQEFVKFVQAHRMFGGNSEEALRKTLGWTAEELDGKWAEYVKGSYSRDPTVK